MEEPRTTVVSVIAPHPSEKDPMEEFVEPDEPEPEIDMSAPTLTPTLECKQKCPFLAGEPQKCPFLAGEPQPYIYRQELDAYTLLGSMGGAFAIGACLGLLTHWAFSGPKVAICAAPISSP